MRIVEAHKADGSVSRYVLPSIAEALAHSRATHGSQFDHVEKKRLEGGVAMPWAKVED